MERKILIDNFLNGKKEKLNLIKYYYFILHPLIFGDIYFDKI